MGVHFGPASLECARRCNCELCRACVAANELRPAMGYRSAPVRVGPPEPAAGRWRRLVAALRGQAASHVEVDRDRPLRA
jgi:hypothetical protein